MMDNHPSDPPIARVLMIFLFAVVLALVIAFVYGIVHSSL